MEHDGFRRLCHRRTIAWRCSEHALGFMLCAKVGSKRNSTSKRAREQWCLSPCACHRALRSPLSRSHALWVVASILSAAQEEPNLAQGHLGLFGVSSFSAAVLLRMLLLVCRNWMAANAWCKRVGERAKARTFASRLHLPARAERGTRQVVPVGGAGPGISWTCPTTTKSAEALLSMGALSCSRIGSPPPTPLPRPIALRRTRETGADQQVPSRLPTATIFGPPRVGPLPPWLPWFKRRWPTNSGSENTSRTLIGNSCRSYSSGRGRSGIIADQLSS